MTALGVPRGSVDRAQLEAWVARLRRSTRVKTSVKETSADELLDHYGLAREGLLTNLGVLLLGTAADRSRLGTAPVIQALRYDERGVKVRKHVWDDYALSPIELGDAVWNEVPDFRESYELPVGMFRTAVPAYEGEVVRELLVNALVHRPYTQRGDIFLNLHPDHVEVVNPGRLPLGVTPRNILHESRRRNDGLARVFHDFELMEREGSGIDLIYDRLLRATGLDRRTTLTRLEPHRLRALILEDLKRYPDSGRVDIHRRIGPEIHAKALARELNALVAEGSVAAAGERRWRSYRLADSHGQRS